MNNNNYYTILVIFGIFGCVPKTTSDIIIPPAPKQTESVLPNFQKIKSGIDTTITNHVKINDKLVDNKKVVLDQRVSILESLAQAEKIKEKALAKVAITELEAINLIHELKKVENRNLFLENQNVELANISSDQEKVLNVIKKALDKTEEQINAKEEEAKQLRAQWEFLKQSLITKNNESEYLKKQLQKEKEISASAKVYKHWIIGLVSAFILWLIIKNVLMLYFPTTKFRI